MNRSIKSQNLNIVPTAISYQPNHRVREYLRERQRERPGERQSERNRGRMRSTGQ
jgi:hypothetical protein